MSRARLILATGGAVLLTSIGAAAFAYTSGVVVAPSNAGVTPVAVHVGSSVRRPLLSAAARAGRHGASPTTVAVSAPVIAPGGTLLEATVTSLGEPVNGVPVTFALGSPPETLCSSSTDAEGVATCTAPPGQAAPVNKNGYSARSDAEPGIPAGAGGWPTSASNSGTSDASTVAPASILSGSARMPPPTTDPLTTTTAAPTTTTTPPPTTTTDMPVTTADAHAGS